MTGIGSDIEDVLGELGTEFTIYRLSGESLSEIASEYMDFENYYKHSTDFVRQNVYTCDLAYNTQVLDGDILDMDGIWVMVMNCKATKFEQEIVIKNAYLVETNCLGKFARKTTTRDSETMEEDVTWTDVYTDVRGTQIEHIRNPMYELTNEMQESSVREILYIPKYDDVQIGDRWYPDQDDTTEYYKIVNKITRTYAGLFKLNLAADTRT